MWMGVTLCPQTFVHECKFGVYEFIYQEILFFFAQPSFFQLLKNVEKHLSSWSVSKKLRVFCTHQAMFSHHLTPHHGRWSALYLELLFCLGTLCVALHFVPGAAQGAGVEYWGRRAPSVEKLACPWPWQKDLRNWGRISISVLISLNKALLVLGLCFSCLAELWRLITGTLVVSYVLGVWRSGGWKWELSFAWS